MLVNNINMMFTFNMKKYAFTLAEVLITLAIIGIVAAMTVPTIIHKFQIKALQTQLKETFAIINQAWIMTKSDLGVGSVYSTYTVHNSSNGFYRASEFKEEFLKHIRQSKKLTTRELPDYSIYSDSSIPYVGDNITYSVSYPDIILSNGATLKIALSGTYGYRITFIVDVNGLKGPNRVGHDMFLFVVSSSNDILEGRKMDRLYTEEELENLPYPEFIGFPCSIKSKQHTNGIGCAWYALKDICPDDETKGYWECLPK